MQFTTLTMCALSVAGAFAQSSSKTSSAGGASSTNTAGGQTVHVVTVGSMNGSLTFSPNDIQAKVGEMVQFQFMPANHSVVQSTFDAPCQPISKNSNVTGIFSGYMPVQASASTAPTYTIMVANKTPMWLYCSQGKHCQNGMVMVINANPAANASRTLQEYTKGAKQATANLAPNVAAGGVAGTNNTSGSNSGSGTGTGSDNPSSTDSASKPSNSSPASAVRADVSILGMGSMFAIAWALFL
ncbi:uncharacterized protein BP5553_07379 [Venustampulla echinocandica]|uniref:Cupredoxin n=1 Tax=Venustampulla echinocandica TaxID=2656787 RepID=A0A370TJC1_9HELO|nr:uncharacterized protein BP5553_07379 [Venustampulla echinocandica]RDL35448.1 hypothetical protein BP5553_07379 [Venustampulla echinocandica]